MRSEYKRQGQPRHRAAVPLWPIFPDLETCGRIPTVWLPRDLNLERPMICSWKPNLGHAERCNGIRYSHPSKRPCAKQLRPYRICQFFLLLRTSLGLRSLSRTHAKPSIAKAICTIRLICRRTCQDAMRLMIDRLKRRELFAAYDVDRGSVVLVSDYRQVVAALQYAWGS
jgi:hypothetical protein